LAFVAGFNPRQAIDIALLSFTDCETILLIFAKSLEAELENYLYLRINAIIVKQRPQATTLDEMRAIP
jgi:hypothetical protein